MAKNYVCDGAKIECKLCTKPDGELKVTSNEVKIQDKKFANAKDKEKVNLIFQGNCKKSPYQASACQAVIKTEEWQDTADAIIQDAPALLEDSTIMCAYGGAPIKITNHLQVHSPQALQPVAAPVIAPLEDPEITSVQWKCNTITDENRGSKVFHEHDLEDQVIDEESIDEKLWAEITTLNLLPNEKVDITLKDKNEKNGKPILFTARVDSSGKARVLVKSKGEKVIPVNNALSEDENADDNPSNNQSSERVLVEQGVLQKGYTTVENGKPTIVDKNKNKEYDWVYADAPSEALMKQNGMTSYDITNINLTKSYPETLLRTEMKSVLWGFSDIEDGFGKNGIALANHFFSGQGAPFTFDSNSNPSREVKDSTDFKEFIENLSNELKDKYIEKGYVKENIWDDFQFKARLPYYSASRSLDPRVNEIVTFVGGIQGAYVNYEVYKNGEEIEIEIKKVSFLDTFGAGWEDGGAEGMMKQWIPGLVAMFCLQHFKNVNDKTKYQPFMVILDLEL